MYTGAKIVPSGTLTDAFCAAKSALVASPIVRYRSNVTVPHDNSSVIWDDFQNGANAIAPVYETGDYTNGGTIRCSMAQTDSYRSEIRRFEQNPDSWLLCEKQMGDGLVVGSFNFDDSDIFDLVDGRDNAIEWCTIMQMVHEIPVGESESNPQVEVRIGPSNQIHLVENLYTAPSTKATVVKTVSASSAISSGANNIAVQYVNNSSIKLYLNGSLLLTGNNQYGHYNDFNRIWKIGLYASWQSGKTTTAAGRSCLVTGFDAYMEDLTSTKLDTIQSNIVLDQDVRTWQEAYKRTSLARAAGTMIGQASSVWVKTA
jgi:hypothetical protein